MIETIMIICALTSVAPYYDCDEKWLIFAFDEKHIRTPYGVWAMGFSWYPETLVDKNWCEFYFDTTATGDMCNMKYMAIGNSERDDCIGGYCKTPLWHELLHLKCNCDWHKGWKGSKPV